MTYSFQQLKDSLNQCTSYDLVKSIDDDNDECYLLIDSFGDQDGDPFYDLDDVTDFITNNDQVDEYLYQLSHGGN
jgi:hypothetical protein